jgi:alpha,alpha-trehalase
LRTEIAGREVDNEDLVNLPNWLPLTFRIEDDNWFNLMAVDILAYRQELDLVSGVLLRHVRFRDKSGRETTLQQRRLVHMHNPHIAALETTLTAENWSGSLEIRTALNGQVLNDGVERYRGLNNKHLHPLQTDTPEEDTIYLKVETNQSELRVAEAACTRIYANDKQIKVQRSCIEEPCYIAQQFQLDMEQAQPVTIEKIVTLFTSRDWAVSECGLQARQLIARTGRFDDLLRSHRLTWRQLWLRFRTEGETVHPEAYGEGVRTLRLHLFHLLQTVSMHTSDLDTGVPARGWHGEAYRGHIFWDELFIFPTLNLRIPEITRALLLYRCRRLDEARANANTAGYRGAMYPWQSGSDGREESQLVHFNPRSGRWLADNTRLQRHVNAAIAYNFWQYYQATGDMEFLAYHGAEVILEIARFWASIAVFNPELERYEIRGVVGPDEYHDAYPDTEQPGLNNNAYTNLMAVWSLCCALEVLDILSPHRRKELCGLLEISQSELDHWNEVSRRMYLAFHDDVISQFEGYNDLKEFDWEGYQKKYGDIRRLDRILEAEGDTPNRYKVSKQADVLMLFYLFSSEELEKLFHRLGYPFEYETIPRNIDYYMKRTSHGSTLSQVVHAWVLARVDRPGAWSLFRESLDVDLGDAQGGTTHEGIHLGALSGTVDLLQRGHTGIEIREDMLHFNPCLPDELKWLRMRIRYRTHLLILEINHKELRLYSQKANVSPIRVAFRGQAYDLAGGETKTFIL